MYEGPIQDLIDELGQLPGIGPRSAQRIAFHVLAAPREDISPYLSAAGPPTPSTGHGGH